MVTICHLYTLLPSCHCFGSAQWFYTCTVTTTTHRDVVCWVQDICCLTIKLARIDVMLCRIGMLSLSFWRLVTLNLCMWWTDHSHWIYVCDQQICSDLEVEIGHICKMGQILFGVLYFFVLSLKVFMTHCSYHKVCQVCQSPLLCNSLSLSLFRDLENFLCPLLKIFILVFSFVQITFVMQRGQKML